MPRLHPRMIHDARKIDKLLPLVLQATRDLGSAKNELRWLKEYITSSQQQGVSNLKNWDRRLRQACLDRARGKPLQYILGSEYFGDLEILCQKGVLIPRQETATSVTHLMNLLHRHKSTTLPKHLRLLDLCTGSGCIPLLSHYELCQKHGRASEDLELVGVDISPLALALSKKNLRRLVADGTLHPNPNLQFLQANILASSNRDGAGETESLSLDSALQQYDWQSATPRKGNWDILISNPPYISPAAFAHTTTRSVKRYEPLLALVPPSSPSPSNQAEQRDPIDQGDLFYPRLLSIANSLSVKVALFEVADLQQAKRVAAMAEEQNIWDGIEIWRDDPSSHDYQEHPEDVVMDGKVRVVGAGNGRSVVVYRGVGRDWMGVKDRMSDPAC